MPSGKRWNIEITDAFDETTQTKGTRRDDGPTAGRERQARGAAEDGGDAAG
jgi:hypothetical protein